MDALAVLAKMLVVFALLGVTLWVLKRTQGTTGPRARRTAGHLAVVGNVRLSKTASIALVRIGDEHYALGVTDHGVSVITGTELHDPHDTADGSAVALPPVGGERAQAPSFAAAMFEHLQARMPQR